MKNYRPLILQELSVSLPGLRLRRLRLNRHLPEVDALARHAHPFAQVLCYLSGRGTMVAGERRMEIGPGAIAFLPPGVAHSFKEAAGRRPLCLVIDCEMRGARRHGVLVSHLALSDAGLVRRELSSLTRLADPGDAGCRLLVGAAALRIADILLRKLGVLPARSVETPSFVRRFDRLLEKSPAQREAIAALASQLGYQRDYLNRIFKAATGQTLRQYRDAHHLARARRLLREGRPVGEVASGLGFSEQNYFARWFKKSAGIQPRAYQARPDRS
ncbi:MAG: AraC family transcriptional regulator [Terrimicrobiaceae bacterium]|nr:AraC family transcriptional regulator [Terrimicrobiaceae bacterium]